VAGVLFAFHHTAWARAAKRAVSLGTLSKIASGAEIVARDNFGMLDAFQDFTSKDVGTDGKIVYDGEDKGTSKLGAFRDLSLNHGFFRGFEARGTDTGRMMLIHRVFPGVRI